MNDANETALKIARSAEPSTRNRLRAWTVREVDGSPALVNLSYTEEGEVEASVIWVDHLQRADLTMIAAHMNSEAGVGVTMVESLISQYASRAASRSLLHLDPATRGVSTSIAIH
ncbi:hypothetical protein [Pseudomonas sp. NPDC089569]|uniref:hypothetical protein n=1 Tax=Pseudomonas sp. NPDC089569 TaxID=3390722 RepID=UPI003D04C2BF